MARDYLAIQGSSVPSERIFSSSKHTDSYLRNSLAPETMGALQIAKGHVIRERLAKERDEAARAAAIKAKWEEEA